MQLPLFEYDCHAPSFCSVHAIAFTAISHSAMRFNVLAAPVEMIDRSTSRVPRSSTHRIDRCKLQSHDADQLIRRERPEATFSSCLFHLQISRLSPICSRPGPSWNVLDQPSRQCGRLSSTLTKSTPALLPCPSSPKLTLSIFAFL